MFTRFALLVFTLAVGLHAFGGDVAASTTNPVLVELFTSEGCSSCPPADRLLIQLEQQPVLNGAELFLLGEHVDYWNELGWKDRFSSHSFSQRQSEYASHFNLGSVYTPQMVIDGEAQLVGNDKDAVGRAIASAALRPKPAHVALTWIANDRVNVKVENAGNAGRVLLAVTEDGLMTNVGAGENGGRVLRHAAVVRVFREIGSTRSGAFQGSVPITLDPAWNRDKTRVLVFVQDPKTLAVMGAAAINSTGSQAGR
jgi:hypothetical protein